MAPGHEFNVEQRRTCDADLADRSRAVTPDSTVRDWLVFPIKDTQPEEKRT
jgi:hypothetical protein